MCECQKQKEYLKIIVHIEKYHVRLSYIFVW